MEERQWCNCRVNQAIAEKCREYFIKKDIYFEPSAAYDLVHFEFYANDHEFEGLNLVIKNEIQKGGLNEAV